ncbi:MAG: 3-dehydroquinate synthase, partial [Nitrospirae bacterium]
MKIVLTGFMATGKSSTGRELAKRLGYEFVDTDELIVEREGMSIKEIFEKKGEPYFRELEKRIVKEVSKRDSVVIAPGGGAIKDEENMRALKRNGIMICLRAEPEEILRRVKSEEGVRPLLNVPDPLSEIKRLLREREKFYREADFSLDTDDKDVDTVVDEIIKKLGLYAHRVHVGLGKRSYDIFVSRDLIGKIGIYTKAFRPTKVAVISNPNVFSIYGDALIHALKEEDIDYETFLIPDGEQYKDLFWVSYLYDKMLGSKLDRGSVLIALGGGVIGDITGFVASTYMRGISYIQLPTTLLAQVDSSVGGKTGVNHPLGKNMIGSFWQPSLVIIDINTLKTLPEREFRAGMAEVIKYGVIYDNLLFEALRKKREEILELSDELIHIIRRCCQIKSEVVSKDEREEGLRAILNFGHTIGHAIEAATGYTSLLHGEAIAIGMCMAAELSVELGLLNRASANMIKELIDAYGLPTEIREEFSIDTIMEVMRIDKKFYSGSLRFVLLEDIG